MKKLLGFVTLALCMICACSKQKTVTESRTAGNEVFENPATEKSAGELKLEKVLASLSEKCRAAIPLKMEQNDGMNGSEGRLSKLTAGGAMEFLSDLNAVLESEHDDLLLLVDKKHYLPQGYVPKNLVPLVQNENYAVSRNDLSLCDYAETALVRLSKAALSDGIKLTVSSTYRSYEYQKKLFNRYAERDGKAAALRYSAPAGTSQHQLGLAVDFGSIDDSFAQTKAGRWLNENAARYGWSLSFPEGYEDITGYMWECWHFRYIGREACEFQKKWFSDIQQFMLEFLDEWKKA